MAAPTYLGIVPSGDTRCPAWCVECSPEICHRSYAIDLDFGEVEISLSVRQWRNGWPDEFEPGWQPAHVSCLVTHKTEMLDEGYGPDEPIIVRASDPMPLSVHYATTPGELRALLAAQSALLGLLERDGGVGHE